MTAVPSTEHPGGTLEDNHSRPTLRRRKRGAQGGVAAAKHRNVIGVWISHGQKLNHETPD